MFTSHFAGDSSPHIAAYPYPCARLQKLPNSRWTNALTVLHDHGVHGEKMGKLKNYRNQFVVN